MISRNSYISFDIDFPKKVVKSFWGLKKREFYPEIVIDYFCWMLVSGKLKEKTDLVFYNNITNKRNSLQLCEDIIDPIDPSKYDFPEFYIDFSCLESYDEIIFGVNVLQQTERSNQHLQNAKIKYALYIDNKKISFDTIEVVDEKIYFEFCSLKNQNNSWSLKKIKNCQIKSVEEAINLRQTNE